ncbi:hypothetical protein BC834DRAFT_841470 [Gloeopeniophorella convolvens]|nr:hypothetical protein BC834DRAFT_841470 [Gloeopeniophorella convolvens]
MSSAPLLRIPVDILEFILESFDDPPDLLALALTCTTWKHLIIPRHIAYRRIYVHVENASVWKHLAARPSLAANVRKLTITDWGAFPGLFMSVPMGAQTQWQIPAQLDERDPEAPSPEWDKGDPLRAVKNMRLLKTIEFESLYRLGRGMPDELSLILAHIPTVEHLVVKTSRASALAEAEGELSNDLVWELPNLKSAVMTGLPWRMRYLHPLRAALVSASSLQVLHIPHFIGYTTDVAMLLDECRFPALVELNLGWGWTSDTYVYAQRFLEAHPTLETLAWSCGYAITLRPGALPRLKHLSVSHMGFLRALSAARAPARLALETLGDLFLFSRELPPELRALDGAAVRRLSLKFCDSLATLRAVAAFFPRVTHLSVHSSIFVRPASRWGRALRRALRRVLWHRFASRLAPACPRVEDVIPLFPELEDLSGFSFQYGMGASSLQDIRTRFPKLRRLEHLNL